MSTEKIIKQQARKSLVGNWSVIIFAFMTLCAALIFLQSTLYFALYFLKLCNIRTGAVYDDKELIYNLVVSIVCVLGFLISPLVNGVLKMCANVALNSKTEISDMFYFFSNLRVYIRTLIINSVLFIVCLVLFFGLDVYALACRLLDADLHNNAGFDIITLALFGALLLSIVIKLFVYFIFVHYPLVAYALDDSGKVTDYLVKCVIFAVKNLGKTIKLAFSFFGWIVLCFFVAPLFYVLPYIAVSAMISAKWLILLDNNSLLKN